MASIPLPALDVKPPAPTQANPLQQYAEIMGLRNEMQEQPLRQQALQNQVQAGQLENQQNQQNLQARQALNQAYAAALTKNNDGSLSFDADKLQQGLANGPAAYQTPQVMKGITDFQKSKIDLSSSMADLQQKQADMIGSAASAVRAAGYDPTLAHSLLDSLPQSPQMNAVRARIDGNPQQFQQLIDSAIQNSPAQQKLLNAQTVAKLRANTPAAQEMNSWLQANPNATPADYQQMVAQQAVRNNEAEQTDPNVIKAKEDVASVEGAARAAQYASIREYPVYDNKSKTTMMLSPEAINLANTNEPGRYTVANYSPGALGPKDVTNYFLQGKGGQQLTAFNAAIQHLNTLDSLGAQLGNSNIQIFNKAAQRWATETGNPAPANFDAAKNAMSGEVAAALKASGATDQEIEQVGQTFSRAQSPAQIKGAIGTYRGLLQAKAKQLEGQYQAGMHGLPNFNGVGGGAPPTQNQPNATPNGFNWNQFGAVAH